MSKIHESLKANQEEILAALPENLRDEFKKELEMPPVEAPVLTGEAEIEAIKAEIVANPSVDEKLASEQLKEISAPGRITPLSEAEAKAEAEALLAEVKAQTEGNS